MNELQEKSYAVEFGALREYQQNAIERTLESFERVNSTLYVAATGTGKTITFASLIASMIGEKRVIVMAHRDELIQQAADKIHRVTGLECDIEKGDLYADQCAIYRRAPVLVTSVQTMSRPRRMERFHPEEFTLLIVDEAHHATAPTYQAVFEYFRQNPSLKIFGVTATPDRADEAALGRVFEEVACEYSMLDAIDDGWLVPVEQQFVSIEGLDLSQCRTTAGDLNQGDLSKIVEQEKICLQTVSAIMQIAKDVPTIVFAASVAQADLMCEIANWHNPGSAEWICGDTVQFPLDRRREILRNFRDRQFNFLFNCMVLTEGFDQDNIGCVAVARPTKSRALYAQMIGRGTRPIDGLVDGLSDPVARKSAIALSEKPSVLVLDFVGNSGRHKLVNTADILGGNYDDEIVAAATRAVQAKSSKNERADMLAELRAAEERRRIARLKKRAHVAPTAKFTTKRIDPFDVFDITPKREPGWHRGRKPTAKQLSYLERCGVPTDGLSFHKASQIIEEAIERRRKHLATFKQSKILLKHGFESNVSFEEASSIIDRIAKSGWKLRGPLYERQ